MGIKGLNQLLKRVCGNELYDIVPVSKYAGKKIAVDSALYVCVFKLRTDYVESCMEMVTFLKENLIEPVFVFDGEMPEEKRRERERRSAQKLQQYVRIEKLEEDLRAFASTGKISADLKEINDNKIKQGTLVKTAFKAKAVIDYVKNLRSQILTVTEEDFVTFKRVLNLFGVPTITAEGEAELLCAQMVRSKLVDAVLTTDTDALACLATTVLTKIEGATFREINLQRVLEKLGLTESQFVDVCIMCGTDFNSNISKIGPVRSYDLIRKHGSIESVGTVMDISILNHERTKELFGIGVEFDPSKYELEWLPVRFEELATWIAMSKLKISPANIRKRLNLPKLIL